MNMKKVTPLLFTLILSAIVAQAQVTVDDSVSQGAGYANLSFYNLATGDEVNANARNWDLQIGNAVMSQSIRINDGAGSELYKLTSDDTSSWNTIDTTGMTRLYNVDTSWEEGAFAALATGHPDYGWGTYDDGSHEVIGYRIFVIKTINGNFKKIWLKKLGLNGGTAFFEIALGNLDNSDEQVLVVNKNPAKSFIYYALDSAATLDLEPAKADWDLVFRRYQSPIDTLYYTVSGALSHPDVLVAEARGVNVTSNDYSGLTFSENISTIGSDWKTFNNGTFMYEYPDSLAYFVDAQDDGYIYKLVFTKFGGTGTGKSFFTKTAIPAASVGVEELNLETLATYPNPATERIQTLFTLKNDANVTIRIIDLAGKTQMQLSTRGRAGLNNLSLNVNELATGYYLLSLDSGSNKLTYKFVKN